MIAARKYTALHPVEHDGVRIERGDTITLSPDDAAALVTVGALTEGVVEVEHPTPDATVVPTDGSTSSAGDLGATKTPKTPKTPKASTKKGGKGA